LIQISTLDGFLYSKLSLLPCANSFASTWIEEYFHFSFSWLYFCTQHLKSDSINS